MSHFLNIDLIILFFFLGVFASWIRSDLEFPDSISKFLSIFLLLSLGLKGGHEVRSAESLEGLSTALFIGFFSCLAIPIYLFGLFKNRLGSENSAAVAACYGSVSAVTLIAAQGMLSNAEIPFSGFMVAVMALMEIPAIVVALYLFKRRSGVDPAALGSSVFSAKSVVLLLGGFVIGLAMTEPSFDSISPVVQGAFKGVLAFFLLDLGIAAQRQLKSAWQFKWAAIVVGIFLPLIHGTIALALTMLFEMKTGDQILLAVLVGSASYIAAPAAIRTAIPGANPSLYVALPLALTFPMNVLIGIPYYIEIVQLFATRA